MGFQISHDIFAGIIHAAGPVNDIDKTHFYFIQIRDVAVTAEDGRTDIDRGFAVKREIDGKFGTHAGTGKHTDDAVMLFDESIRNGKPQTRSFQIPAGREERLKNMIQDFFLHTDSVILNFN